MLTLGIYEFLWFYRNWRYIRDRDGVSIRPFWRAIFAPLHYRRLIADIDQHRGTESPIPSSRVGVLVIGYFILSALWRLPGPFWVAATFSWMVLLPVVSQIIAINRSSPREFHRNSEWKFKHLVLGAVMVPFFGFLLTSSTNFIPSPQVVPGARIWEHNMDFLRNAGLLEEGEEVLYFYSQGQLSTEEEGNILTDSKVVSYWKDDETSELFVETARYDEIATVDTEYSYNVTEHTVITVRRNDGSSFILVVSPENNRDVPFVDALKARIP